MDQGDFAHSLAEETATGHRPTEIGLSSGLDPSSRGTLPSNHIKATCAFHSAYEHHQRTPMHSLPATVLVAAVTLVVLFSCPHQVRAYSCQHDHVIAGYATLFLLH